MCSLYRWYLIDGRWYWCDEEGLSPGWYSYQGMVEAFSCAGDVTTDVMCYYPYQGEIHGFNNVG